FKLRHRIYKIMGYLDEEAEQNRSQLEINEADTHALHVGAFYKKDQFQEVLVGTARVTTNTEQEERLRELIEKVASGDPAVRQRLDNPYGLSLPIFQSHKAMNPIIGEVFRGDQICGELSRVTVERAYRGSGISRKLIDTALGEATRRNVKRVFLE